MKTKDLTKGVDALAATGPKVKKEKLEDLESKPVYMLF
jgi:hypothetical protein